MSCTPSWVPNHIHLLITPKVPLHRLTRSLKGITAKSANLALAQVGSRFWQEESYDREVRHEQEFERIRFYIENNPVRAGLVAEAGEYRWSSATRATGGRPRTRTNRPSVVACTLRFAGMCAHSRKIRTSMSGSADDRPA